MLGPQDRSHLLAVLHPPDDYGLDAAIGTTYSLDLLAALTVPLAFTLHDAASSDGPFQPDPLALLEALRRNAERLHLFCQSGRIAVPAAPPVLVHYLEQLVHAVQPPQAWGVFHPKVWVLRFAPLDPARPMRYRLLCLSRNLTFDRSWDTALVLDGTLTDRRNAFAANHPLGDFIAALPGLAIAPVPARTRAAVDQVQGEIRRVAFDLPAPFTEYEFVPLGIDGYRQWSFPERRDRVLVVSPFLHADTLDHLSQTGLNHALVSREESLDEVGRTALNGFGSTFVLTTAAEPEELETDLTTRPLTDPLAPLAGLHAKLFVIEQGWNASVYTGSANATKAAFEHNVEFMVGLHGKRSVCGVDAFLKRETGQVQFADLLEPYRPKKDAPVIDLVRRDLETRLQRTELALARTRLVSRAAPDAQGAYSLTLQAERIPAPAAGVEVWCWPISVGEGLAQPLTRQPQSAAVFTGLAVESLSAFLAVKLIARVGNAVLESRFVLTTTLVGAPADRPQRVLRLLLGDKTRLLRFLLMLLADPEDAVHWLATGQHAANGADGRSPLGSGDTPLFEVLLRALAQDPARLDAVARLLADLRAGEAGPDLLPADFDQIWAPIWAARQTVGRASQIDRRRRTADREGAVSVSQVGAPAGPATAVSGPPSAVDVVGSVDVQSGE